MAIDITVGIVTWKAKDLLGELLHSIYSHMGKIENEIVVVDNLSEDGTIEMLKKNYPKVNLIKNPFNEGVAPARNRILQAARGRYILSLDVDTSIMPGAIETMVRIMDENPSVAIGGPKLVYRNGDLQLSCRSFPSPLNIILEGTFLRDWFPESRFVKKYTMEDWTHDEMREVDWLYGACLIIRKDSLQTIGLFDEKFFYLYEDIDLCFRAKKSGFKVMYIPQATVTHFLERERKGIFHPRINSHIKSIFRYLLKDRYGILQ